MTIALGVRNFAECDHCCRQFIKTAAHDALRLPRSPLDLCRFCSAASIARRFVYVWMVAKRLFRFRSMTRTNA